jgi:hypothetical protein
MNITHVNVYGLTESIIASGLPMRNQYDESVFESQTLGIEYDCDNPHYARACKLADNPTSSGHLTYLSGIVVQMNITATVKWWEQWQRYHFQQIISSMSTMHRLRKMMKEGTIQFNEKTRPDVIEAFMKLIDDETVTDEQLAYSCPMGIELTARVSTNYLQLRTMYQQRHTHKLEEWRDVCNWIRTLPYADQLILWSAV